jgi:S-DNA-T family DNA segregation ATPase FtsK/SpoIIIE
MSSPGAKMFVDHWANLANGRTLLDCIPLPADFSPVQSGGSFLQMPDERATTRPALSYGGATARHVGGGQDPRAKQLEDVLAGLGFRGAVIDARPGPTITLYAFQPEAGAQESKIIAREKDIQREMSAVSVRVAAIPGTRTIGIEISNANRDTVLLTELLESRAYRSSPAKLALALGKTIGGEPVITDLVRMPHLLLAGTTGSGKSVGLNVMIISLLYRMSPEQLRFIMIDPKELELAAYDGIPHLLRPIATDPGPAIAALEWAITEMGDRYKRMRGKVMGIADYQRDYPGDPMPYLVIVVDEVADLMAMADKKVIEGLIQRLAQKGRAAGIHLIIATQRPSVDVITGVIKANFPSRIAFQVVTGMDSKVILDTTGAEQLLGQGDALFMDCGRTPNRVHVSYTSMPEIQKAVSIVKEKWGEAQFEECESEDAPVFDGTGMGEREQGTRRGDQINRAKDWLRQMLSENGPMLSSLLYELASREEPSIAATTLLDASKRLNVVKTNPTEDGKFKVGKAQLWGLP